MQIPQPSQTDQKPFLIRINHFEDQAVRPGDFLGLLLQQQNEEYDQLLNYTTVRTGKMSQHSTSIHNMYLLQATKTQKNL